MHFKGATLCCVSQSFHFAPGKILFPGQRKNGRQISQVGIYRAEIRDTGVVACHIVFVYSDSESRIDVDRFMLPTSQVLEATIYHR